MASDEISSTALTATFRGPHFGHKDKAPIDQSPALCVEAPETTSDDGRSLFPIMLPVNGQDAQTLSIRACLIGQLVTNTPEASEPRQNLLYRHILPIVADLQALEDWFLSLFLLTTGWHPVVVMLNYGRALASPGRAITHRNNNGGTFICDNTSHNEGTGASMMRDRDTEIILSGVGTHAVIDSHIAVDSHLNVDSHLALDLDSDAGFTEDSDSSSTANCYEIGGEIQIDGGKWEHSNFLLDTASTSSFISRETVDKHKIKERPIHRNDLKIFTTGMGDCKPTNFVRLTVKIEELGFRIEGLNLTILDKVDIDLVILGTNVLKKYDLLSMLKQVPSSGKAFMLRKKKLTKAQKARDEIVLEKDRQLAERLGKLPISVMRTSKPSSRYERDFAPSLESSTLKSISRASASDQGQQSNSRASPYRPSYGVFSNDPNPPGIATERNCIPMPGGSSTVRRGRRDPRDVSEEALSLGYRNSREKDPYTAFEVLSLNSTDSSSVWSAGSWEDDDAWRSRASTFTSMDTEPVNSKKPGGSSQSGKRT